MKDTFQEPGLRQNRSARWASLLVSTPVALFRVHDDSLHVLLEKWDDGILRLPACALDGAGDLDGCAAGAVAGTGCTVRYMEQLLSFRATDEAGGDTVVIAYFGLAPDRGDETPRRHVRWTPVADVPALPSIHQTVVDRARERLVAKTAYTTIAFNFLAGSFTLSELQSIYEAVLGEALDKRNFRKRVLALDCLRYTGRMRRAGSHRPARLYEYTAAEAVQILK
jgi:8-oxo-dGTP diphosphatase